MVYRNDSSAKVVEKDNMAITRSKARDGNANFSKVGWSACSSGTYFPLATEMAICRTQKVQGAFGLKKKAVKQVRNFLITIAVSLLFTNKTKQSTRRIKRLRAFSTPRLSLRDLLALLYEEVDRTPLHTSPDGFSSSMSTPQRTSHWDHHYQGGHLQLPILHPISGWNVAASG